MESVCTGNPRTVGSNPTLSASLSKRSTATPNFGVWAVGTLYAPTWQGLVLCYTMALPYLLNTMAGNLFYAGVFFGGYALAKRHVGIAIMELGTA